MNENLNIICAGSSISWTGGLIAGFVGGLDRKIRFSGGHVFPGQVRHCGGSPYRHFKLFDSEGLILSGNGSFLEFDFTGDTLHLCQLIQRTSAYAEMSIYADGELVNSFDNRNPTLGSGSVTFTGDGSQTIFPLGRPFTFNHQVRRDDALLCGEISRHDYDEMNFAGRDYLIIRSLNTDGQVEHVLVFPAAPEAGTRITAEFSYGESIGYVACTVGENDRGEMESVYGYAGPKPNYGLDFRYTNPKAFRKISLPGGGTHRIRLEITGGDDPYFIFNFAANRACNIVNAGIGGWHLRFFMNDDRGRNVDSALSLLKPDVMFLEYSANDDWYYFQRKTRGKPRLVSDAELFDSPLLELYSLKDHQVENSSCVILELAPGSLRAEGIFGAEPGDIARIGNEVREISAVDGDRIYWDEPLSGTEAREVAVRSLKGYEKDFGKLIDRIRARYPEVTLFLTAPAGANYDRRQLWGYDFALRRLAARYRDCHVVDTKAYFASFQPGDWVEHAFVSDGGRVYELPWTGYSQYFELTPEYDFTVECTDRFEAASYQEFSLSDPVESDPRKAFWRLSAPVPMRLVFKTPPSSGARFSIRYSPGGWSHDYCHPNPAGCEIYANAYYTELMKVLENR